MTLHNECMFTSRNHNNTALFVKLKLAILKNCIYVGLDEKCSFFGRRWSMDVKSDKKFSH